MPTLLVFRSFLRIQYFLFSLALLFRNHFGRGAAGKAGADDVDYLAERTLCKCPSPMTEYMLYGVSCLAFAKSPLNQNGEFKTLNSAGL